MNFFSFCRGLMRMRKRIWSNSQAFAADNHMGINTVTNIEKGVQPHCTVY